MAFILICISISATVTSFGPTPGIQQAKFMRRAIELAKEDKPPYCFGALIADPVADVIVAEGHNNATVDPVLHGEIAAINNLSVILAKNGSSIYQKGPHLDLYTTAEPCPMCMSGIIWSHIGRVFYGTSIPVLIAAGIGQINARAAYIAAAGGAVANVTVIGGVLANETDLLYNRTMP
eukprot:m.54764 g.54764  ORF g.54764 m.54764 type:complete len:178 (-) comp10948_c0_seq1:4123-4656(-)